MRMRIRSRASIGLMLLGMLLLSSAALLSSSREPKDARAAAVSAASTTSNYVRPGVKLAVNSVQVGLDRTVAVNFTVTDPQNSPLDYLGVQTPGPISFRYYLAYLAPGQNGGQYIPLTLTNNTTVPGKTVVQPGGDSGGTFVVNSDGTYTYIFATLIPVMIPNGSTLTVGMTATRTLTDYDAGIDYANITSSVLIGTGTLAVRDVVTTATCNKCHSQIAFHGGSRRTMELCVMCHVPGYVNPQTGNSIDLKVMAHKIHMGEDLPSVKAGTPYQINTRYGNNDYSTVAFPAGARACKACHADDATQAANYKTKPTRAACGSCHDDVNFATGANHAGIPPQSDDTFCASCHIPQGDTDFDASVVGAHVLPNQSSLLPGIGARIVSVTNTAPGQKPVLKFQVWDNTGRLMALSAFSQPLYRLAAVLGGPASDYVGINTHGYVSEDLTKTSTLSGDVYTYNFTTAIPADAKGTYSITLEGRRNDTILSGTAKQQTVEYGMKNVTTYFAVDGSTVAPRRQVVSLAKCNNCHFNLSLHGENRNQIESCVVCHNPIENDSARRPAAALPAESIDFALMIHRIHAGKSQTRDFTIYGYGGSKNNFNNVGYPGDLSNCEQCHLPGTYTLPIKAVAKIADTRGYVNPVYPTSGACLGCHATADAASHVLNNTSSLGESCKVCHGPNGQYSVAKVHAN